MASAQRKIPDFMTVEEFIAWPGDGVGGRYQLIDGVVRAMSPASTTHGTIQSELNGIIRNHLKVAGTKCRSVTEPAVEVRVRADINMRVPNIGVSCASDVAGQIALPEPLLLIEILSPGNAKDTWENVWAYTTIPSVQEIVVVHSTRIGAEVLRRIGDGTWAATTEKLGENDTLRLASIGLETPLREAYANTHLA
jgi:Uma2 family endonuclease